MRRKIGTMESSHDRYTDSMAQPNGESAIDTEMVMKYLVFSFHKKPFKVPGKANVKNTKWIQEYVRS